MRTTAEILLAVLEDTTFLREHDVATGYAELVIRPRSEESARTSA